MLGLLVPSVSNAYHGELAEALDAAAQACGFRLVLGNGHSDGGREQAFIEELVGYGVRGIIVACEHKRTEVVARMADQGVAFVLIDERGSELELPNVDVVKIDNAQASALAVRHLAELGHRHIAYVTPRPQAASRQARLSGYRQTLEELSLEPALIISEDESSLLTSPDADPGTLARHAAGILAKCEPRPTAVLALNDTVAIGLLSSLRDLGLSVPADMSVMGIDDIQFSRLTVPTLSTLRPPFQRMAAAAIDCVQTRLTTPGLPQRQFLFPLELVARASSAAPGTSSFR